MQLALLRQLVKEACLAGLGSTPVVRLKLAQLKSSGALTILNLHRVAADDGSSYKPLSPRLFEYLLEFAQRHFTIVTFAEALEVPANGRPKLVISFDDAYKDFLDTAVPLLEKHRTRVNQNIIPECVESGLPPLNVLLQDFVGRAPPEVVRKLEIPGFSIPVGSSPYAAGHSLSVFVKNRSVAAQNELKEVLIPQIWHYYPDFSPTPMMTREEVRQIAHLHEIGAHSYSHASMAFETDEYLREDLDRCRVYFQDVLGLPLSIYALPNGSYRSSQLKILGETGIRDILLVDEDFSLQGASIHRRFTFDALSSREVRFRAVGGFRWPHRNGAER